MREFTCPECAGEGGRTETVILERNYDADKVTYFVACYYCAGTGFQTDETSFEEFTHVEL